MRWILTFILACLPAAGPAAEGLPQTAASTVKAAGLDVRTADFLVQGGPEQCVLLWDAYPSRKALGALALRDHISVGQLRRAVASALVEGPVLAKCPAAAKVRIAIAEFPGRGPSGLLGPSGANVLERLEATITKAGKCVFLPMATAHARGW